MSGEKRYGSRAMTERELRSYYPRSFLDGQIVQELLDELDRVRNALSEEPRSKAHARYEFVRRLNVPQFKAIFERCLKGERFDDVIDACLAGCTPECREEVEYPGCAICMSPR